MKFILVICLILLISCRDQPNCDPRYTGVFSLNYQDQNETAKILIKRFNWDTLRLISLTNGTYHFNISDSLIDKSRGTWFTESTDLEGNCFGYIKQNNTDYTTSAQPFDIAVSDGKIVTFFAFRK